MQTKLLLLKLAVS